MEALTGHLKNIIMIEREGGGNDAGNVVIVPEKHAWWKTHLIMRQGIRMYDNNVTFKGEQFNSRATHHTKLSCV